MKSSYFQSNSNPTLSFQWLNSISINFLNLISTRYIIKRAKRREKRVITVITLSERIKWKETVFSIIARSLLDPFFSSKPGGVRNSFEIDNTPKIRNNPRVIRLSQFPLVHFLRSPDLVTLISGKDEVTWPCLVTFDNRSDTGFDISWSGFLRFTYLPARVPETRDIELRDMINDIGEFEKFPVVFPSVNFEQKLEFDV